MATANNIIESAFRKIGMGIPSLGDANNALISFNNMISLWGVDFLVHAVTRENFDLTVGESTYTIGSGGDFDTVRPLRIMSVFLRDSNNIDTNVEPISVLSYDAISYKISSGRPLSLYYVTEYPLAKIIFSRKPDKTYNANFEFLKNFTEASSLTTDIILPDEYKTALVYNLAVELAEDRSIQLSQTVIMKAIESKALIDRLLVSTKPPPKAKFEFAHQEPFDIFNWY